MPQVVHEWAKSAGSATSTHSQGPPGLWWDDSWLLENKWVSREDSDVGSGQTRPGKNGQWG